MKAKILNRVEQCYDALCLTWLSVRQYIKKWCIASFFILVALLVADYEYENFACHHLQAYITGDPSLTGSERFALRALLFYPSYLFRSFMCGAYVVFVMTLLCFVFFYGSRERMQKRTLTAQKSSTDTTPEVADV
ncbi:hypothetical protein FEI17_27220 (plasmid) [Kosakonia radicincitans]|uniref:hypothetical protein n=1 Tax=Kosakonia radicincitans TaxID=283686 RepID=UPI0011EE9060|nr:hypothetical protein [Kosakonia radicincitans]QEM94323.1 hypothetical protein FEI17_27220 [Kosakonia radicincitans]